MNPSRAIAVTEEPQRAGAIAVEPSQLLETATDVLLQGLRLLFQLDDQAYSRIAPLLSARLSGVTSALSSSDCAASSTASVRAKSTTTLRNETRLEQQVAYASVACCDLLRAFKKLTKDTLNKGCVVVCSGGNEHHSSSPVQSTLGRELEYCIGHALHHFDIIRLICDSTHIRVPREFGDASVARKVLSGLVAH